jgi:hypothetical protein
MLLRKAAEAGNTVVIAPLAIYVAEPAVWPWMKVRAVVVLWTSVSESQTFEPNI